MESDTPSINEPGPGTTGEISSTAGESEHFKPVGTLFILALFTLSLILLWASVYVILISRGVTT